MDFTDSPEEAAFRAEVRAWLDANAERRASRHATFAGRYGEVELLQRAKDWQAKKAAAGYAAITGP